MCAQFYVEPNEVVLRDYLEQANRSPLAPRFRERSTRDVLSAGEILPSAVVPVIAMNKNGARKVFPMRWGFSLKPFAGTAKSRLLINARSETAAEKPMFREAWRMHRCAIPASWYYEWEHQPQPDGRMRTGQKYAIRPRDQRITWLAGLYRMEDSLPVFTVLTRAPGEEIRWIHDRMPMILPEETVEEWISPQADPEMIREKAITSLSFETAV